MCVRVRERERGGRERIYFVDKQGNRTDLVEILCARPITGHTELMPINVVVG